MVKSDVAGFRRAVILACAVLFLSGWGSASAAPAKRAGESAAKKAVGPTAQSGSQQNVPIVVTSERMEANDIEKTVVFTGHVIAVRGAMKIYADRMEVFNEKNGNKISRIVATGHVRIIQEGKSATGEQAVYYDADQKVVLTGKPKAREGDNVVTGTEIVYYLNEHRSLVKGSPGNRIQAVIVPTEEDRKRVSAPGSAGKAEGKK